MIKKIFLFTLLFFSFLSLPQKAHADSAVTPLSIGLVPPLQFPSDEYTITGLRLSALWGRHRNVYGIDLGLLGNVTDQNFSGLAASGVLNMTGGNVTILGLQLAGLANINSNKAQIYGLQIALGLNQNSAESSLVGLQIAVANISSFTDIYGAQLGIYNTAKDVYGFQFGLINRAVNLHGIQIGLLNFHHKGVVGVSPILNIGF